MSNKSFRVKYDQNNTVDHLKVKIGQDFDFLEVLSLKIRQEDAYKLYTSDYGVIVGRVLANDGFGIPNAKVSIFIKNQNVDNSTNTGVLYPYTSTSSKNSSNVRYNLLPSEKVNKCHQNVGTFPTKNTLLDNNELVNSFDDFYKYTTVTNESGDYMIFGSPVGTQQIHVDIDLSDIGVLSQSPRDMEYKGYGVKQFDSPNKFKKSTNLDSLPQIITENTSVFVYPFWGDPNQGEIAISKKNINLQYKFEPTCVFMGSIFTDSTKAGMGKTCNPSKLSGNMSDMITSQGSIEMIRETIDGKIENFSISGNRLINNDGVWCYQIPMNLDYVITDELGNIVPTNDPTKGIPTRTKARFRVTLDDNGDSFVQSKTGSYLIPNNPKSIEEEDYQFDSNCKSTSFVNLMWNKVYSVKNYIPRISKSGFLADISIDRRFNGLKSTNYHGANSPAPYNNIFIDINLRFMLMCFLSTFLIRITGLINRYIINTLTTLIYVPFIIIDRGFIGDCQLVDQVDYIAPIDSAILNTHVQGYQLQTTKLSAYNLKYSKEIIMSTVDNQFNPSLNKASVCDINKGSHNALYINDNGVVFNSDTKVSITFEKEYDYNPNGLTNNAISCIETQLSSESQVVNFDFNNDWVNGGLYAPRFLTKNKKNKKTGKVDSVFCGSWLYNNYNNLYLVQTCAVSINKTGDFPSSKSNSDCYEKENCYKSSSMLNIGRGIIKENKPDNIFYYRSIEFEDASYGTKYIQPTGIILLGSLNDCDMDGIPQLHQLLPQTSFKLPPDSFEPDTDIGIDNINETSPANQKMISGIDWGNSSTNKENGLFVAVGCSNSSTITKTCVNASRLCEVGVDFDEKYTGYNGNLGLAKYIDGYISNDEISDGDVRGMFATLNGNNLKTKIDEYNQVKYDFKYTYPNSFDGRLKTTEYKLIGLTLVPTGLTSDYTYNSSARNDYYNFRFGLSDSTQVGYDYTGQYRFPRYENSFYFYFGLKHGLTALDLFNTQYFVPCSESEKDTFDVTLAVLNNEGICDNTI